MTLTFISLVVAEIPPVYEIGVFGRETQDAVKAFQEMWGIEPTGIVDELTWNALVRVYRQYRFGEE